MTATPALEIAGALAFAGDLSMGQPVDHSPRAALIAHRLALRLGLDPQACRDAALLALLRWAGCTANAAGFAAHLGDDIAGRAALIRGGPAAVPGPIDLPAFAAALPGLARAHCEVGALVARGLNLSPALVAGFADLFERWDGAGVPAGKAGTAIATCARIAMAAGMFELTARLEGPDRAAGAVAAAGGATFDPAVAAAVTPDLLPLPGGAWAALAPKLAPGLGAVANGPALLAAFAELKAPAQAGLSFRAARLAAAATGAAGLGPGAAATVEAGVLLQALGNAAVPLPALAAPDGDEPAAELRRLAPYWTSRILSRAPSLAAPARIAARIRERADGGGAFAGLAAADLAPLERLAAAALAYATAEAAGDPGAALGPPGFIPADAEIVRAAALGRAPPPAPRPFGLTARASEVLALVAVGRTNPEIGALLGISPKTVGAHLGRIFDKLGVTTRAAAGFVALRAGLL